jgi:hypothetical protein
MNVLWVKLILAYQFETHNIYFVSRPLSPATVSNDNVTGEKRTSKIKQ